MKVRVLYTEGHGRFVEQDYDCPDQFDNGIIVQGVMTGVCTSDVAMMQGEFGPLPLHMQGHEGLGQVIEICNNIKDVEIGDFVKVSHQVYIGEHCKIGNGCMIHAGSKIMPGIELGKNVYVRSEEHTSELQSH